MPLSDAEPEQLTHEEAGICRYADVSPDGSLVAFATLVGGGCNLWVMPSKGGATGTAHLGLPVQRLTKLVTER